MSSLASRIRPAYALMVLFVTSLILGIVWGGFGKVLAYAAILCLECIGII